MGIGAFIAKLLQGGAGNLAAYLAAHVLLCLLPAFFIAGGMSALIPKESVTRFLGRNAPKFISYPAAALAGSVLAVCSCTIVPLFAGIYKKGAGLGPAITFLFFAPAANILALAYTGVAIGPDLAFARFFLSLIFGIGIGLIMALIFSRDDAAHEKAEDAAFSAAGSMRPARTIFLLLIVALLLSGTLQLDFLTRSYGQISLPVAGLDRLEDALFALVPYDASRGEEGVTAQGLILIVLLGLITLAAWKGFEKIFDGFTGWTWAALGLAGFTLVVAAVRMTPQANGLLIDFRGKMFAVLVILGALVYMMRTQLSGDELRDWIWESWRFVKQIFPLLIVGVFTVGILRQLIQPEWIKAVAGSNTLLGNLAGVAFGVFMYFPTLVEVPIANMFLSLGMHRGPLLAYLMADPELSLQSILIVSTIIGKLKSWTYVGWVALFSTLAGLIYGAWIDGMSLWLLVAIVTGALALLGVALWQMELRNRNTVPDTTFVE